MKFGRWRQKVVEREELASVIQEAKAIIGPQSRAVSAGSAQVYCKFWNSPPSYLVQIRGSIKLHHNSSV
jgi:hypothetical protein